jgi:small GTP-binding protein
VSGGVKPQWGAFQLLTSPGPAAIAAIRVRGPLVEGFLRRHIRLRARTDPRSWTAGRVFRGELLDEEGQPIDDMLISIHTPAPTWDVRLHLHGSPGLVHCCTEMLHARGLSEHAEAASTLWHSENMIEAEAYALLPRMLTLRGVQWLTRQSRLLSETLRSLAETSDIEVARERCREIIARRRIFDWFARPLRVALVGPPNVGKSTLANALADQRLSIVSPVPGTTRDWVELAGEVEGFPVLWLDTAGLRRAGDELEAESIRRTRQLMKSADTILLVLDATAPGGTADMMLADSDEELHPPCVALNKCDLIENEGQHATGLPARWREVAVPISALRRRGLDTLAARLLEGVGYDSEALAAPAAFTDRQVEVLKRAAAADRRHFPQHAQRCLGAPPSA